MQTIVICLSKAIKEYTYTIYRNTRKMEKKFFLIPTQRNKQIFFVQPVKSALHYCSLLPTN